MSVVLLLGLVGLPCVAQTDYPRGMYCGGNQLVDEGQVTAKSVRGTVADFYDVAIAGARIQVQRVGHEAIIKQVEADRFGRFKIRGLPSGEYWLGASAPGMNLHYRRWLVPQRGGSEQYLKFKLSVGT